MPTPRFAQRLALAVVAPTILATMPACIAWEIRDELTEMNQSVDTTIAELQSIDGNLVAVNERLGSIDTSLAKVNASLANIDTDLDRVARTNDLVDNANVRLKMLESVQTSLASIDKSLMSLRGTIENIDSTIPFLKFSDPGPDEEEEAAAESDATNGERDLAGDAVPHDLEEADDLPGPIAEPAEPKQ